VIGLGLIHHKEAQLNRRRILASAAALLALPLVTAGKCDPKDDGTAGESPHKNPFPGPIKTRGAGPTLTKDDDHNDVPDPWEAQDDFSDRLRVITISVWLELEFCPYTVDAEIRDPQGNVTSVTGDGKSSKWEVSEGQWRQTVGYAGGEKWKLTVRVQAKKPGTANGYIAIRDGKRLHQSYGFNRTSSAVAEYTSAR
jgi:hypothetical protein